MNPADPRASGPVSIGAELRTHRLDAGLSQSELAARLAIHPSEVARIERSTRPPDAYTFEAFISVLELSGDRGMELRKRFAAATVATPRGSSSGHTAAPAIWGIPGRNVHFTGRDEALANLRRQIAGGLRTAILPVALRGLGGVGKTQLALEFAHRFKTDYDIVWWIDAEQLELIDVSLADLADKMGLATTGNVSDDAREALEALRRGEPYARWLLVFDNAAEPDGLAPYLPDPGTSGHLLITSRDQSWASVAAPLEVDVYSRRESVLRLTTVVRELTSEDAEAIAQLVGDLPLAVESAAAWLAATGMPVATYLEALAKETLRVLSLAQPRGYALPVAAVWNLSLRRVREQSPAAAHLLELASLMSPDGIAIELFYNEAAIEALRAVDERVTDVLAVGGLVQPIARLSLVRVDRNELRVHRLIQEAVRARFSDEEHEKIMHIVHRILTTARPVHEQVDDPTAWPRYARLWHHLAPARVYQCDEEHVRELMIDRLRFLWTIGEYDRALQFAQPIAASWIEKLGADDRQTLALMVQIATVHRDGGNLREAYQLNAATLAKLRTLLPPRHPLTLTAASGLGGDLRGQGEFDKALILDRDTHAECLEEFGSEHPRTLNAANNLAVSARLFGDIAEARRLDEVTWARRREVLGPDHPITLCSLMSRGENLLLEGEFEESVHLLTEAMNGLVDSLGRARPYTLRAATMLAWALDHAGRHTESLALADETAAHYAAKYRPQHPGALLCMMTLAAARSACAANQHDRQFAAQTARDALVGFEGLYGPDHPSTLACANNTAVYELRAGNPREARALLERARHGLDERLGHDHPHTRATAHNLALTLRALGRRREARSLDPTTRPTRTELELPPIPL